MRRLTAPLSTAPRSTNAKARFASLFELGKFRIVELWLGFFAGASLLPIELLGSARVLCILAAILTLGVIAIAATCALDDITGMRDGVDQANHIDGARWGVQKPLLQGRLRENDALRFVRRLAIAAAGAYAGVLLLAWPLPGWIIVLMTCMILLAVNYSYGLKLSYFGAGELVIFVGGVGTVLLPFALAAKSVSAPLLFDACLVGAWHAQVVMFSNTKDADGDRSTKRMTIAARTSKRGNKIYIFSAFAICWGLTAAALLSRTVHWLYGVALVPVWAMQLRQLWLGLHDDAWLRARLVGFRVLRIGIAVLTLANIATRR